MAINKGTKGMINEELAAGVTLTSEVPQKVR